MKTKTKSVKKNFFYNRFYQIFLLIVPIITTPYISRVLGSEKIGQYSFSYSIAYYFTLFASLGFSYYAQREIAKYKEDKEKQSTIFWEINIIRAISTLLAVVIYLGIIQIPYWQNYRTLLYILVLTIVAIGIDPSFIFQGNEDFKQITIRSFIVKALVVTGIFVFIKTRDDLWIYTLLNALNPILSALIRVPFLKKYLVRIHRKDLKPLKHLVPCLKLFIPTIAVSIYTVLDKTRIGFLVQGETTKVVNGVTEIIRIADIEEGYYEQANRISQILVTIVTALGTVRIPRNTYYFAIHKEEKVKANVYTAIKFVYFLGLPRMFGLIAVADNFGPWFFGDGYEKVPLLRKLFAPLVMLIGLSNVFGIQYLIPKGEDKKYTVSILIGAGINLVRNAVLIHFYQSAGAVLASLAAELSITIAQRFRVRKTFPPSKILAPIAKYFDAALIRFIPAYFLSEKLSSSITHTLLIVFISVVIYGGLRILFKDEFVWSFITKAKAKLNSKKKKA